MNVTELIIKAVKVEASLHPNEKLIIGSHVLTYSELAEILGKKHNRKKEKKIINIFLKQAELLFNSNPEFKNKVMELAGQIC